MQRFLATGRAALVPCGAVSQNLSIGSHDTGCTHPYRSSSLTCEDLNPCSEQHRIRAWQVNLAAQAKPPHALLPLCSYPALSRCCCRATALCPVVESLVLLGRAKRWKCSSLPCPSMLRSWVAQLWGHVLLLLPHTHWSLYLFLALPQEPSMAACSWWHQKQLFLHSVLPSHVLLPQRGHIIDMALDSYTHPDTHSFFCGCFPVILCPIEHFCLQIHILLFRKN